MNKGYPGLGQPVNEFLGPGAVYFDYGLATEIQIGLTKGGSVFNDNAVFKRRDGDGDYTPVKGAVELQSLTPQLTINSLKINVQNMLKYYAGMVAGTASDGAQSLYRAYDLSGSYVTNVAWVGKDRAGNNMAVVLDNCLGDGPVNLSPVKDEEIVPQIIFTAHADPATFDPDDKTTWPYHFDFEVSTVTFTVMNNAGTPVAVADAAITLDDGQTGTTNENGVAVFSCTFGSIGYTVSKAGHTTVAGTMVVDSSTEAVAVTLPVIQG